MKNFWGSFLGSILGASIAGILFAFLVIAGVAAVISSEFGGAEQAKTEAEDKTVLHLTFSYPVVDASDQNPFAEIDFGSGTNTKLTLWETINILDYASTDAKVVGLFLDIEGLSTGMGNAYEIRQALERFKAKGKFIATYSEGLSQKAYYFASVSTHLSLNAHSDFLLNGMGAELLFFRGVLDKLGVEHLRGDELVGFEQDDAEYINRQRDDHIHDPAALDKNQIEHGGLLCLFDGF